MVPRPGRRHVLKTEKDRRERTFERKTENLTSLMKKRSAVPLASVRPPRLSARRRLLRALQRRHVFVLVVRVRGVHKVVLSVFAHGLQGGQVERVGAVGFFFLILVHPLVEVGFDVRVFLLRAQQTRPVRTRVLRARNGAPFPKGRFPARRGCVSVSAGIGARGGRARCLRGTPPVARDAKKETDTPKRA